MTQFQEKVDTPKNPILTVASLIIIVAGMKAASPLLTPLFLALFTAIVCWPLLSWLHRRGVPSGLAVTLVITGLIIALIVLGTYVFSSLNQFTKGLPAYQANLQYQTAGLIRWLHEKGISLPNDMNLIKELNAGKVMKYAWSHANGIRGCFCEYLFYFVNGYFFIA